MRAVHRISWMVAPMPGRVLFVDDDPAMGGIVQKGLARHGFEVEVATSGDAAFARILDTELDAVVTDLRMAGMSGLELAERIAANARDLPVIVITAFGSLETAVAAMRAGAYD